VRNDGEDLLVDVGVGGGMRKSHGAFTDSATLESSGLLEQMDAVDRRVAVSAADWRLARREQFLNLGL
jgi:hypothetical protein